MALVRAVIGPYATNCYLVADEKTLTVIDPGLGASDVVKTYLEQSPELSMDSVVLTHGHLDHSCEAGDLAEQYDVPVFIHDADAFMLDHGSGMPATMRELFHADRMKPIERLELITDGDTLQIGGRSFVARHAPGHSPGCIMLVGSDLIFSGDVLFQGSIGRVDLPFSDPEAMKNSLRDVVYPLDSALNVLPGHGPGTTMGREKNTNPFLQGLR